MVWIDLVLLSSYWYPLLAAMEQENHTHVTTSLHNNSRLAFLLFQQLYSSLTYDNSMLVMLNLLEISLISWWAPCPSFYCHMVTSPILEIASLSLIYSFHKISMFLQSHCFKPGSSQLHSSLYPCHAYAAFFCN